MSDAGAVARRAIPDERPRLNKDLFLAACEAKGAVTDEGRAALLGMPRKSVFRYVKNETEPRLTTARWIAEQLGVTVDDLWPAA